MLAPHPDLFPEPPVPGFAEAANLVSPAEECTLTAAIDAAGLAPFRFQGWLGKRLTRTFGWRYDFDDRSFAPAAPIPGWLMPLRERVAAFAGLAPDDFVHALVTRYDPGAGIGWHRDRPLFEHVVGVSLGAAAVMRFRRRRPGGFDRASAVLAPRSAYRLSGEIRHDWEHSIAALDAPRWSVTFRTLSEKGRRQAS